MSAVPSKDFVWANEGLQEIDQVIDVDITELCSEPVPCVLHIVFESFAACGLWRMFTIAGSDTVPISHKVHERLACYAVLYKVFVLFL